MFMRESEDGSQSLRVSQPEERSCSEVNSVHQAVAGHCLLVYSGLMPCQQSEDLINHSSSYLGTVLVLLFEQSFSSVPLS